MSSAGSPWELLGVEKSGGCVQQTVRKALAAALHHSAGPKEKKVELQNAAKRRQNTGDRAEVEVHQAYDAPRRQNRTSPGGAARHFRGARAAEECCRLRRSAEDTHQTLGLLVLAGASGEVVDSSALPHSPCAGGQEQGAGGRGGQDQAGSLRWLTTHSEGGLHSRAVAAEARALPSWPRQGSRRPTGRRGRKGSFLEAARVLLLLALFAQGFLDIIPTLFFPCWFLFGVQVPDKYKM